MGRTACRLLVVIALLLFQRHSAQGADRPAEPALNLSALNDDVIRQIDRIAAERPLESRRQRRARLQGDLAGWLIARAPLSAAEEAGRARALHQQFIAQRQVVKTPPEAEQVFKELVARLPAGPYRDEFKFSLTVFDDPARRALVGGGGFVSVSSALLENLQADRRIRRPILDFLLARELGHIALGHCRRGFELELLEAELRDGVAADVDRAAARELLQTSIGPAGTLVRFVYSLAQEFEADLFALHLCRNAGRDPARVLDGLRYECLLARPELANAVVPADSGARPGLPGAADPFLRLKHLLNELSGEPDAPADYGLFVFDREREAFHPAAERSIAAGERAIVFIHGMEGRPGAYSALLKFIARNRNVPGAALLEFRYPNDQSLARSGEFLTREIERVSASGRTLDFVCHSAGGLVFRYYAEVNGGAFRRAVFQGTPHGGSDLARLRTLLEAAQILNGLKLGFPEQLERAILDGNGEIAHDLQPGSLFLEYLAGKSRGADRGRLQAERVTRYFVIRARALRPAPAALLATAVTAARHAMAERAQARITSPALRRAARHLFDNLSLPVEISAGDLCVSQDSATIAGIPASNVFTFRGNHLSIKSDPEVMPQVVDLLEQAD